MKYKTQKKIIFALETRNTINILVNRLTQTQMKELLFQTLRPKKNESVVIERKYKSTWM